MSPSPGAACAGVTKPLLEGSGMLVFDAHLDVAWNAITWNRDQSQPVAELRRREADMSGPARGGCTVSFPELRKGKVRSPSRS